MENNKLFNIAIAASLEAGKRIMSVYTTDDFQVTEKADSSPLTRADRSAHETIVAYLKDTGIPVLSEEGRSIPYEERSRWDRFWLVDPLDGTKEFIKRNGEFTVNIALIVKGVPEFGVVFAPALDLLYVGISSSEERMSWEVKGAGGAGLSVSGNYIEKLRGENLREEKLKRKELLEENLRGEKMPEEELPGEELRREETREENLQEEKLRREELRGEKLLGGNIRGVNLQGEELSEVADGVGVFTKVRTLGEDTFQKGDKQGVYRVVASRSHLNEETEVYLDELRKKYGSIELVAKGSSLKLCMVASGEADEYPRLGPTMEWDIAAAHAVVSGSGKRVMVFGSDVEVGYNKRELGNGGFRVCGA